MLKAVYPRRYTENIMYDIILYNLISLALLCVLILELFVKNIKAVEGSGSEGDSKYMGEGVTYGVLLVIFLHAHACRCAHVRSLTRGIGRCAQLLTSSRHNIVIWCRIEH